jgi:drug/metabolite transporter (DMT)-like permease
VNSKFFNWILFIVLCLIWGSSFELMKLGMFENHDFSKPLLTPYQFAALRMLAAGLFTLPFAVKAFKQMPKNLIYYAIVSGLLGSFIPAFLFCLAETKIGGAIAGSLNSLTPLFVILTGMLFFKIVTNTQKIIGVLIGLCGSILLIIVNQKGQPINESIYILFVVIATIMYGINVNMVSKKLTGIPSLQIASIAFSGLVIPSLLILFFTHFFDIPFSEPKYTVAVFAGSLLGVLGTSIASILFYMLVKKGGGLFASLVTYGIPFVAIGWGIINNETITSMHYLGLVIILFGVYFAYREKV